MFFIEELHKILYQPIKKKKEKVLKDDIIKKAKYYDEVLIQFLYIPF